MDAHRRLVTGAPPAPQPHPGPALVGPFTASGRHLLNGQGQRVRPLGITGFTMPWGLADPAARARYLENAGAAAAYGAQAVRVWGEVGGASWADRVIDPRQPGYPAQLADTIDALYAQGLLTILTLFAGGAVDPSRQDQVDHAVQQVVAVARPRLDRILLIEIANEDNFPGSEDDLNRCARALRSALPSAILVPCGLGTIEPTDQFVAPDRCNAQNVHQERTDGDRSWRQARQLWDFHKDHPLTALEPMGVALHQGQDLNDPVRLAMCWAVGLLRGFQCFVLHNGPGVRHGGAYDAPGGPGPDRAANYWEEPAIAPCAAALRVVEHLLPVDVADWAKTSQRGTEPWADNFLYADQIWSDGFDHGVSRNYVAYAGDRVVCLSFGVLGYAELIAKAPVAGTLYELRGGTARQVAIPAGGRERLEGNANADQAYILVGTRG